MFYESSDTPSRETEEVWSDSFDAVARPDTLCATAARRRGQQRSGAKVRRLTPVPQQTPVGRAYRPVRALEHEVMVSVSEDEESPVGAHVHLMSAVPPNQLHYRSRYDAEGPDSPRRVQYSRTPGTHARETSGACLTPRIDWTIQADGTIVNVGPGETIQGERRSPAAFDAGVPQSEGIFTVVEQNKGGPSRQVIQVIEDCSCFDAEPKPQTPPQSMPCRECLDEMYYGQAEQARAASPSGGAISSGQVHVVQEATHYETNADHFRSLQVKQEHILGPAVHEEQVRAMTRSNESKLGAVIKPDIHIIHEERLVDPNAPPPKEEPSAPLPQTPKEATSATTAAPPGTAGKDEPKITKSDAIADPSVIPVKSLSDVCFIQDFPKFDVPPSVRIIHSAASASSGRPSSMRLAPEGGPVAQVAEPLHILKEERRFEAVNLIQSGRRSSSQQRQHDLEGASETPDQRDEAKPETPRRKSSRGLERKLSHTHVHHTWSNNSQAALRHDVGEDHEGGRRSAREPADQKMRLSRRPSYESNHGRSYERPWEPQPPTFKIQSRRRPAGLHINLTQPEHAPSQRPPMESHLKNYKPRDPPPKHPEIDARSANMEEVARHAWEQYSREYKRYLSNLADWNEQQEILRNQLGNLDGSSAGADSELNQSSRSHHAGLDEEPMRIRIALSGNSLRRGRSGTSPGPSNAFPQGSPKEDGLGKHTVCAESISLVETVEPPDPPRCSSHIEANRQRKERAAEEAEFEASFEERADRRVHMTPLCTEHMSYRAFSSNSPTRLPPSRPSTPRGSPLSRLAPVLPVTKHYMERVDFPDDLEPLRRQIPPRKNRRHFMYPVFPQFQTTVPRDFFIYFLVSMATLASIFAAIGVFSKHERDINERLTQNAPMAVSRTNGSRHLAGFKRRAAPTSIIDVCKSTDCESEGRYMAGHLNWAVEPCIDFQAFACNKPRPEPLKFLEQSVASQVLRKSPTEEIVPLKYLYDYCMKADGRSWDHLRAALSLLRLGGWPFEDSHNLTRELTWDAAAQLERYLGLGSLFSISVQPRSKVLALSKADVWPQSQDRVMKAEFTKYAAAIRPSGGEIDERANEVVGFARKLEGVRDHQPRQRTRPSDSPYGRFVSLLGLGAYGNGIDLLFSKELATTLAEELESAEPHVVMNYQGLIAVQKISPLLPGASVTKEICWRVTRDALPEMYLYAAYRAAGRVLGESADMTETIRKHLVVYVNSASWLEASVRRKAAERLNRLRVLNFVPPWFTDNSQVRAMFSSLPQLNMNNGPLDFLALKEHTHKGQLLGTAWPVPVESSRCVFDEPLRTLYMPLLAANLSQVQSLPLLQSRLPRLGVPLAACMMRVVTAQAGHWWGERSLRRFEPLRKCVASQGTATRPSTRDALLDRLAALLPVHNIYSSRLHDGERKHEYRLKHAENITADQMFFIYFAGAQCHEQARMVNVPLQNYDAFRRAFGCHPGDRMSPAKSCRFWTS